MKLRYLSKEEKWGRGKDSAAWETGTHSKSVEAFPLDGAWQGIVSSQPNDVSSEKCGGLSEEASSLDEGGMLHDRPRAIQKERRSPRGAVCTGHEGKKDGSGCPRSDRNEGTWVLNPSFTDDVSEMMKASGALQKGELGSGFGRGRETPRPSAQPRRDVGIR